ncbi:L-iditol 2-dehydrogenase [Tindallia magadiensis]|uniref:L-iditol 2-dehydrogenase n=1 Tax=Tindallia magadiensis TaxID=69895 RepID=A0A1I3D656_9FIRM|nr:NAD(P)-dependent alcohol dehydrogenase [Tindallia magadiensis]SFH82214.1 L-iditol 2-dehydrogenase [Tindallia magadiensis]
MKEKMKAAVMKTLGVIEYEERPIPTVKEDEVLVKLEYVGICGSDMHYYETGQIGPYKVEGPFVLGHEASGRVVEIGKKVRHLSKGDKVALEPGITCGKCEFCKTGNYNLCADVEFFATPPYDGVFQEYVSHKADLCFKLPESISTLTGALIEPLAVGMHAVNLGKAEAGQTVVVTGAGAIGLVTMLASIYKGVNKVIVVDVLPKRLEKAKELGATHVINGAEEDALKKIMELTDGKGCDLAIDTAGSEITVNQMIHSVKKGARIVLVGYSSSEKMSLEMNLALDKELTFKTVFRYRHIYPMAIDAASSGKINLEGIVTDLFDFEEVPEAMDSSSKQKADIVKAVIKFQKGIDKP